MPTYRPFSPEELEVICKNLADTNFGLTGTEIAYNLKQIGLEDVDSQNTKWKRLFNALADYQNKNQSGKKVLSFISRALSPKLFIGRADIFREKIKPINMILAFHGLEWKDDGKYHTVDTANSLSEAESRATKLRDKLEGRNVHSFILNYCNAELLTDNYFHAVLEACKSIASLIRKKTGLISYGSQLVDEAFGGDNPKLKINSFTNETEKSEQKGFLNLSKGLFGTFRNPTAHAPKIEWNMTEQDALDIFSLASYIYRRIELSK
jgi:uncharacterized protein (TIGR02391 family)